MRGSVKEMKEKEKMFKAREDNESSIDGFDSARNQYLQSSAVSTVVFVVFVFVGMYGAFCSAGRRLAKVRERSIMTHASEAPQIALGESHGLIFDLPSFHVDTLQTIKTLSLYLPEDNVASIDIGTRRKDSTNSVHLRGTDGASSITIDGCANIATVVVAGRTHIILQPESRALAAKKPRLYSSEEVFGELQSFHKDGDGTYRRLDGAMEKEAKTSFALAVGEEQIQKLIFAFNKSFDSLYFVVSTFEIQNQVGVNEKQFKLWIQLSANESRLVEIAPDGSKKMYDYDLGKIKNTLFTEFDEHAVVKSCKSYLPSDTISQQPLKNLKFLQSLAGSPCRFEKLNINDIQSFVRLDKVEFDNGPPASLAPVLPQNPGCVKAAYHGGPMPGPPGMVQKIIGEVLHSQSLEAKREGKEINPFDLRGKAQKNATAGRRMGSANKFPGTNWCGTTDGVATCQTGDCGGAILSNMEGCCYQHDHGAPEKHSHMPCAIDGLALGCGVRNYNTCTGDLANNLDLLDLFYILFGVNSLGGPGWDCYLWEDTGYIDATELAEADYSALTPNGIGSAMAGHDYNFAYTMGVPDQSNVHGDSAFETLHRDKSHRAEGDHGSEMEGHRLSYYGLRRRRSRRRLMAWAAVVEGKYEDHFAFGIEVPKDPLVNNCPADNSGTWRLGTCRNAGNGEGLFQYKCTASADNIDSIAIDRAQQGMPVLAPCDQLEPTTPPGNRQVDPVNGCCGCRQQVHSSCPGGHESPGMFTDKFGIGGPGPHNFRPPSEVIVAHAAVITATQHASHAARTRDTSRDGIDWGSVLAAIR